MNLRQKNYNEMPLICCSFSLLKLFFFFSSQNAFRFRFSVNSHTKRKQIQILLYSKEAITTLSDELHGCERDRKMLITGYKTNKL